MNEQELNKKLAGRLMGEQIKVISIPVGVTNVDLARLLVEIGACSSRSQGKRLIKQGAVDIAGVTITNLVVTLPPENPVIRCGKHFYRRLIIPRKTFKVAVNKAERMARILEEVK